ncbi:hypothetical protein CB1_000069007 [Camelus ferus]|nr:hypothetical protein CB1_000069007 [Camelus ferus]
MSRGLHHPGAPPSWSTRCASHVSVRLIVHGSGSRGHRPTAVPETSLPSDGAVSLWLLSGSGSPIRVWGGDPGPSTEGGGCLRTPVLWHHTGKQGRCRVPSALVPMPSARAHGGRHLLGLSPLLGLMHSALLSPTLGGTVALR